jgi:hypothetical protein
MTFGFANAPSCFQWYMDKVFAPLLYKNLENYLDDALNHHKTEVEHIQGVCDNITPFSIFISVIPIRSALLRRLGSAPPINVFSLGSAARS